MLSKKMAFSLMSLITIFALAFAVPVDAAWNDAFDATLSVNKVGAYGTVPVISGNMGTATYTPQADGPPVVPASISFAEPSGLLSMGTQLPLWSIGTGTIEPPTGVTSPTAAEVGDPWVLVNVSFAKAVNVNASRLDASMFMIQAFDKDGAPLGVVPAVSGTAAASLLDPAMGDSTRKKYVLKIDGNLLNAMTRTLIVTLPAGKYTSAEIGDIAEDVKNTDTAKSLGANKVASIQFNIGEPAMASPEAPMVVSVQRLRPGSQTVTSAFEEATVSGAFNVRIVFTEKPHDFKLDHIAVDGGAASGLVVGVPFSRIGINTAGDGGGGEGGVAAIAASIATPANTLRPHPSEGMYAHINMGSLQGVPMGADAVNVPMPTGADKMYHQYRVTITPDGTKDMVKVSVKEFHDNASPVPNYYRPYAVGDKPNGREELRLKVSKADIAKPDGLEVVIPKEKRIPASGYIVFTKNQGESGVAKPGGSDKEEPKAHERSPAQRLYNVVDLGIPNLETFLSNGGTIDLVGPAGIYISEIMWGSDASLKPNNNSQWIEVANSGTTSILTGDKTHKLIFYGQNETLPDVSTVADRVGTVGAGGFWSLAGKGQSGRSGTDEQAADVRATIPTQALISMQRLMGTGGTPADGTMASSWAASTPPGLNFDATKVGTRVGTPGAAPVAYPVAPTPEPVPEPAPVVPVAEAGDIKITEIMVDTGDGRLPQWIELANVSGAEKSLAGWSVQISNSGADDDVVGRTVDIDLMGTLGVGSGVDKGGDLGKALLLVAWDGRNSANLDGSERVIDVSSEVSQRGRYKLISDMAFMIALVPPQKTGVLTYGDTAGNLDATEAWELPMSDNGRSSLIRIADAGTYMMGTEADGWMLASDTGLSKVSDFTWYGSDEDDSTPGVIGGGPLPVELSHFRPARDKATGAVVITWATQSELNNAGFFIKRSQQRDGEFKVVNTTMVAGAGTTSEKQFYTYTDSTAQPNVVYYYQIEDVSLDGNRQTLTRGIRLKGHVGAAGKATTTWGELKTSHE
jgi:hypothetical protein